LALNYAIGPVTLVSTSFGLYLIRSHEKRGVMEHGQNNTITLTSAENTNSVFQNGHYRSLQSIDVFFPFHLGEIICTFGFLSSTDHFHYLTTMCIDFRVIMALVNLLNSVM